MHKDDLKPLLWSAAGGAIAVIILGFAFGGWMTSGSAAELSQRIAEEAVSDRLAPICASQAKSDPEQVAKLVKLKQTDSWRRGDAIAGFGWATMPGEQKPDQKVADKCASLAIQAAN